MRDDIDIPLPSMAPGGPSRSAPRADAGGYRLARARASIDPNTRRLAIIAGGIAAVFVLGIGGWSLLGHRHGGVPVIEADSRPLRTKPDNAGGLQVAGQNENILSGDSESKAALAPAPEAPAPQALKDQEKKAAAAAAAVVAASLAAASPPPAPPVAPRGLPASSAAHPQPVAPVQTAVLAPPVESHPRAQAKPAAPAPVVATHPPAAAAPAVAAASLRGNQVQLAALSSEEAALAEWQRLEKRMPDVLGGRKPGVVRIEHDGKTFWRLRTGGFADAAQATSFCDRLKQKGQSCTVASTGA